MKDLISTKNKILEEAFGLFIQKGFTDVSLNELSEKIGISKAGFYHYFKSKDELLNEVIKKYIFTYLDERLMRISSCTGPPKDKLEKLIISYSEIKDNFIPKSNGEVVDFRSFYLLLMEGIKKYDMIYKRRLYFYTKTKEVIKDIINEGKKDGTIKAEIEIDEITEQILIGVEGIIMIQVVNPDENIKQIAKTNFNYTWELIGTSN